MPDFDGLGSAGLVAGTAAGAVVVVLGFEPAFPGAHAIGPAFTALGAGGDNLALHQAVARAAPGDVVVLDVQGREDVAHCGDIIARAAAARGIRGIVVDGAIRDRAVLAQLRYPIFHRGTSPGGPTKTGPSALGVPVRLGGATVRPGDLVCADDDGIVVVAAEDVAAVVAAAARHEEAEREVERRIAAGETTVEIFSLPEAELGR